MALPPKVAKILVAPVQAAMLIQRRTACHQLANTDKSIAAISNCNVYVPKEAKRS